MGNTALDLEVIKARCEAARCEVNRLCRGDTLWTMSVPVREDDTDIILTNSFRDIPALMARVKQLRVEEGQMRFQLSHLAGAEKAFMEATRRAQGAERERDEWQATVKQLQRDLHDERVRRDEWEKMYGQAITSTRVKQRAERAEALAALVNEETAALLERLAWHIDSRNATALSQAQVTYTARALAACIRQALEDTGNEAL